MFEDVSVFTRGLILGLMIAMPVGPIGLMCIRRTLRKGIVAGIATGFGSAAADAIFAIIAVLGVVAILDLLEGYNHQLRVAGGAILLFYAWHAWNDKPRQPDPNAPVFEGSLKAFLSGFFITATNPVNIFAILAVVATFGGKLGLKDTSLIISGIFVGSALWWCCLAGGISLIRQRFTEKSVILMNRVTAFFLMILAFYAMISALPQFQFLMPIWH
jgi:threonine/homoserine/homoserine lactone efflux protein